MTMGMLGPVGVAANSYSYGRGYTDLVTVKTPPAGAVALHVIPSAAYETIYTVCATLTASAVAANRYPTLSLRNGDGTTFATFAASTALVAAGTATITWAVGTNISAGAAGAAAAVPLPDLILPPGFSVAVGAVGLDVGDQLSAVSMYLLHIPTGPLGPPSRTAPLEDTQGLYGADTSLTVNVSG